MKLLGLLLFLLVLSCGRDSTAWISVPPSPSDTVQMMDFIGLVRISGREDLGCAEDGVGSPYCVYVYSGDIVEMLKGEGSGKVRFESWELIDPKKWEMAVVAAIRPTVVRCYPPDSPISPKCLPDVPLLTTSAIEGLSPAKMLNVEGRDELYVRYDWPDGWFEAADPTVKHYDLTENLTFVPWTYVKRSVAQWLVPVPPAPQPTGVSP